MARLRCRLGLHRWKRIAGRRPDKATFECERCRTRYLVPLVDVAAKASRWPWRRRG